MVVSGGGLYRNCFDLSWIVTAMITALLAVSGCSPRDSSPAVSSEATGKEVPEATPASFINRVWVVAESKQVASGEFRAFLSEGTLVMASPHSTPALGTWNWQDGRLTITEEGLKYDVDILELTENTFRIRIRSPGEPVEIRFEPAEALPLSTNPQQPPERGRHERPAL